jgi:hypothetical protein
MSSNANDDAMKRRRIERTATRIPAPVRRVSLINCSIGGKPNENGSLHRIMRTTVLYPPPFLARDTNAAE